MWSKPFDAGKDLDERAEVHDANDLAEVGPAELRLRGELLDDRDGLLRGDLVGRGDVDAAVVVDFDLAAGALDDRADRLAALADDVADLLLVDLDRDDARRVERDRRTGASAIVGVHRLEDLEPRLPRLLRALSHDLGRDPGDLDVHLEARDPAARSRRP